MNYDALLDEWAEKCLIEAKKFRQQGEDSLYNSPLDDRTGHSVNYNYETGYKIGISQGFYLALSYMARLEQKFKE